MQWFESFLRIGSC